MITGESLGNFLIYFGAALLAEIIFMAIYLTITPHKEIRLIRDGNVAAALSLGGAALGFTLPLASVIIHSVSLLDMVVWSAVALVVQVVVFFALSLGFRQFSRRIEAGNKAAGLTAGCASLAVGILNAASMSY